MINSKFVWDVYINAIKHPISAFAQVRRGGSMYPTYHLKYWLFDSKEEAEAFAYGALGGLDCSIQHRAWGEEFTWDIGVTDMRRKEVT